MTRKDSTRSSAYLDGCEAYLLGRDADHNPFELGKHGKSRRDWFTGYFDEQTRIWWKQLCEKYPRLAKYGCPVDGVTA